MTPSDLTIRRALESGNPVIHEERATFIWEGDSAPQIGRCSCVGTNGPRGGPSRPVRAYPAAVSLLYPVTAVGLTGHCDTEASAPRKSSGLAKVPARDGSMRLIGRFVPR